MNFKDSNFNISTIDLFSILLPGGIATLMLYHTFDHEIELLLGIPKTQTDFYYAFCFLLSSYLLGHLIGQLSAYLDEWIYDHFKNRIYKDQSRLKLVMQIRSNYHSVAEGKKYINNFEWSRSRLLQELPEAIGEIERHMADSKFFRGLILILLVLAGMLTAKAYYAMAAISVLVAVFSLIRYFNKKRQASETSYKYVIFLENCPFLARDIPNREQSEVIDRRISPLPAEYTDAVKFLTVGFNNQYFYWSVVGKSFWKSRSPLPRQETLYCLSGKGWLQFQNNSTAQEDRIWLSFNACITVPAGRNLQIENLGNDPLSLISIDKR